MDKFLGGTACALVMLLSGCGGGGGGAPVNSTPIPAAAPVPTPPPPPPPPPTPTATNFDTVEYQRSNGATTSKAITAWQHGATGKGIKIGVIDSGINPSLAEFAGRLDSASVDVAGSRVLADDDGHGTAVAATAAAARNDAQNVGVAFDATIVALRADKPGTCGTTDGCQFFDDAIANGIDTARIAGARVINLSMGGDAPGSFLLNAMNRAVGAGIVLVISAGNDSTPDPDAFGLTAAQNFQGKVIIAGALDAGATTIASYSDQAGIGKAWYLSAAGSEIRTVDHLGRAVLYSGTSFSAPVISGAVALMAQAFPNLTGQQIVQLLFNSADDIGDAGDDAVYGQGRLNIARAFQPSGQTTLGTSATLVDLAGATGMLPTAAGDAGKTGTGLGVVILDKYSRAFAIDLAARLRSAQRAAPLERALSGRVQTNGFAAGPIAVTLSVASNDRRGFATPERLKVGPEDAARARLVAGSMVARIDGKTRAAFGIAESAKALERRLSGAEAGAFLIARDTSAEPGFTVRRSQAGAVRHSIGAGVSLTISGEQGEIDRRVHFDDQGQPYRLASASIDRAVGRNGWVSLGASRLDETRTLLGGRMSGSLGGGGSSTWFLDGEYRHDFGGGIGASFAARRGSTRFAGGSLTTAAYAFDLSKAGLLNGDDRLGLRLSQPLRVETGGLALLLPTAYDYGTSNVTQSLTRFSMSPSGREVDAELGYSSLLGRGWVSGNLFARRQPDHVAGEPTDVGAAIRYALGF